MKIAKLLKLYQRSLLEVVDFSKDCYYCYSVNHVNQGLAILLWIFSLFAFSYKLIDVLTMTKTQYIEAFGSRDVEIIRERPYPTLRFIGLKIKRAIKDNFLYLAEEEYEN